VWAGDSRSSRRDAVRPRCACTLQWEQCRVAAKELSSERMDKLGRDRSCLSRSTAAAGAVSMHN